MGLGEDNDVGIELVDGGDASCIVIPGASMVEIPKHQIPAGPPLIRESTHGLSL
jgi:hypothetical protein